MKKKNSLEFENVYLSNAQINPDEFKSCILRSQYSQELKGFLESFIDSNVLNLPLKIFINNSFFPLVIEDAFIKQLWVQNCKASKIGEYQGTSHYSIPSIKNCNFQYIIIEGVQGNWFTNELSQFQLNISNSSSDFIGLRKINGQILYVLKNEFKNIKLIENNIDVIEIKDNEFKFKLDSIEIDIYDDFGDITGTYLKGFLYPQIKNNSLTEHTTQKALNALFTKVAEEEVQIRKDPIHRVTDLLKKVFGWEL